MDIGPQMGSATGGDPATADGPGKSAQSVGHRAKAAVAAAAEAGISLPKNAQGLAASQIARGVEAALIFQQPVPDVSETTAPNAMPADGTSPTTDDAETALAVLSASQGYAGAFAFITPPEIVEEQAQ